MKRVQAIVVAALALLLANVALAFGMERYVQGEHYSVIENVERAPNTVVEFFSLGCPHCAHLEPALEKWLTTKPANVRFDRIPAAWNEQFEFSARVFFALQATGQDQKLVPPLFKHIHQDKKPFSSLDDAVAFVKAQGGDADKFRAAFDASERVAELEKSQSLLMAYQIRGVPTFLVNGQYTVSVKQAGGEAELFDVVNFLLSK